MCLIFAIVVASTTPASRRIAYGIQGQEVSREVWQQACFETKREQEQIEQALERQKERVARIVRAVRVLGPQVRKLETRRRKEERREEALDIEGAWLGRRTQGFIVEIVGQQEHSQWRWRAQETAVHSRPCEASSAGSRASSAICGVGGSRGNQGRQFGRRGSRHGLSWAVAM
jgi:hypothetical protein